MKVAGALDRTPLSVNGVRRRQTGKMLEVRSLTKPEWVKRPSVLNNMKQIKERSVSSESCGRGSGGRGSGGRGSGGGGSGGRGR